MDRDRWRRIGEIFEAVSGLEGKALERALDEHCGNDEAVRREVASLLEADTDAEAWLAGLTARSGIPAPEAEAALNVPGRTIGAWRLVRQIGRGGMGVVYLAERADEQFHMQAALKALPVGLITREAVARFQREREILAQLEHPHIARLLDGGVTPEGTPFYVMEYVAGLTLHRYCEEYAPSLDARIRLFEQIASAVAYAHRHLVIHRDIKPANILVARDGQPKLLDFGVAKLVDVEAPDTATATQVAHRRVTPAYTAPELLQGEPVTTACDVYSLGIVLYELLAGTPPFEPGFFDQPGWTDRLAEYRPVPPSRAVEDGGLKHRLKGDLDTIVAMAMHPDPARRYATVNALLKDLERHRRRLPVAARPDTFGYRASRFMRRHAVAAGLSAAMALAVLTGLASTSYYALKAAREAAQASEQRDRAEMVSNFLQGIFSAADPRQDGDLEAQVQSLLERADVGLSDRRDEHPLTRAQLLMSYAVVVRSLGRFEAAEAAGRRALDLMTSVDADAGELARAQVNLGNTLLQSGNLEEAETLLRSAMQALPLSDSAEETAFKARVSLLYLMAEARLGPADRLPLLERLEPHEARMRALNKGLWMSFELVRLQTLLHAGQYERTLKLARELETWVREHRGEDHPWLGDTLAYVAGALFQLGRAAEAEKADRETLAVYRASLGPDHPQTVGIHNQLATGLAQQARYREAIEHYRRAVAGWTEIHGAEHPYISRALVNIAQAQRKLGRLGEALDTYKRAYRMEVSLLGPDAPQAALSQALYGRALGEAGRMEDAREHFASGLGTLKAAWGEDHPVVLRVRAEYARFQIRQGRAEAALAELQAIRPGLEEAYGSDGVYPALALAYQGLAEMRLERNDDASTHLNAAAAVLRDTEWREKRHARLLATLDESLSLLDDRD